MTFDKRYWLIILPLATLLFLVVVKAFRGNDFSESARETHRLSLEADYFISLDQLEDMQAERNVMLVDIRESESYDRCHSDGAVSIPLGSILGKKDLPVLMNGESSIVIFSSDMAMSAAAWALLSQLGIQGLYILELPDGWPGEADSVIDIGHYDNEELRYGFVPDTISALPVEEPDE